MNGNEDENCFESDEDNESKEENVLYSFPALNIVNNGNDGIHETMPPLVLELIPLPLLSENFEQMPVRDILFKLFFCSQSNDLLLLTFLHLFLSALRLVPEDGSHRLFYLP